MVSSNSRQLLSKWVINFLNEMNVLIRLTFLSPPPPPLFSGHVHGGGLQIDVSFTRQTSMYSKSMTLIKATLKNKRARTYPPFVCTHALSPPPTRPPPLSPKPKQKFRKNVLLVSEERSF